MTASTAVDAPIRRRFTRTPWFDEGPVRPGGRSGLTDIGALTRFSVTGALPNRYVGARVSGARRRAGAAAHLEAWTAAPGPGRGCGPRARSSRTPAASAPYAGVSRSERGHRGVHQRRQHGVVPAEDRQVARDAHLALGRDGQAGQRHDVAAVDDRGRRVSRADSSRCVTCPACGPGVRRLDGHHLHPVRGGGTAHSAPPGALVDEVLRPADVGDAAVAEVDQVLHGDRGVAHLVGPEARHAQRLSPVLRTARQAARCARRP